MKVKVRLFALYESCFHHLVGVYPSLERCCEVAGVLFDKDFDVEDLGEHVIEVELQTATCFPNEIELNQVNPEGF